jgi:hypothetical protein
MTASSTPRRPTSRLAFHASRIVVDVGVLITLGAMSLRFVNGGTSNVHSVGADALPALLLLIPVFVITLIPDHSRPIPAPLGWLALLFGIAAFPYAIIKHIDAATIADAVGGSVGLGARLLIVGTGITLIGIVLGLARGIMRLPQGGAYPTRPPAPTVSRKSAPTTGASSPAPAPQKMSRPTAPGRARPPAEDRIRQAPRPILPDVGRPEDEDGSENPA